MNIIKTLKDYFGHSSFRPLQKEVIDAILNQEDVLMILPTGGGKSLCYQLPSLLMHGVTVVISPLLALMHDQVVSLQANGISSEMLSSMQSIQECNEIEERLRNSEIKILYIAPERLTNSTFIELLHQLEINFFVVDEAHCMSEWGHEFRQSYRQLNILKENFSYIPICAFTATATSIVETDIIQNLKLNNPKSLRGSLFRKNLIINIQHKIDDGKSQLLEFLSLYKNEAGIIYTLSRKDTESLSKFLNTKGINAKPYHAGLSTIEKNQTYSDFVADKIEIVVATIAFGMGIDKSNIRFVVHITLPKTIENFYQEIGRAGRDGLEAKTLLLFSAQDIIKQKNFIDALPQNEYQKNAFNKLDSIVRFVNGEKCRHQNIANYFDEELESCKLYCDNCTDSEVEKVDITQASKMLLSAIYRTNQRFGLHYIVDILRGSKDQRILQNSHNELSVYAIGKDYSKSQWMSIGDKLLEIEAVTIGEFKVYSLTNFAIEILKGKHKIDIKKSRLNVQKIVIKSVNTNDYDSIIYEKLRSLRTKIASRENIPPYIVFSDKTLKEMSIKLPKNKSDMLAIHGIGEIKYQRYGEEFLKELSE